jgi:large subunit ribosomal protein L24
MKKMKLKKGDLVMVIAGKDKGKQGKITKVVLKDNKVIVENVNVMKKHAKASQSNPEAGIITKQLPIHASNVMLVDPKSGKPSRIGKMKAKDGHFVRFAKNSGTEIKESRAARSA